MLCKSYSPFQYEKCDESTIYEIVTKLYIWKFKFKFLSLLFISKAYLLGGGNIKIFKFELYMFMSLINYIFRFPLKQIELSCAGNYVTSATQACMEILYELISSFMQSATALKFLLY